MGGTPHIYHRPDDSLGQPTSINNKYELYLKIQCPLIEQGKFLLYITLHLMGKNNY